MTLTTVAKVSCHSIRLNKTIFTSYVTVYSTYFHLRGRILFGSLLKDRRMVMPALST